MNKKRRNKSRNRRNKAVVNNQIAEFNEHREYFRSHFLSHFFEETECQQCGLCCSAFDISLGEDDFDREPSLRDCCKVIPENRQILLEARPQDTHIIDCDTLEQCPYNDCGSCGIHGTKPGVCSDFEPSIFNCRKAELAKHLFDLDSWYKDGRFEAFCGGRLATVMFNSNATVSDVFFMYLATPFLIDLDLLDEVAVAGEAIDVRDVYAMINPEAPVPTEIMEYLGNPEQYTCIALLFTSPLGFSIAPK